MQKAELSLPTLQRASHTGDNRLLLQDVIPVTAIDPEMGTGFGVQR